MFARTLALSLINVITKSRVRRSLCLYQIHHQSINFNINLSFSSSIYHFHHQSIMFIINLSISTSIYQFQHQSINFIINLSISSSRVVLHGEESGMYQYFVVGNPPRARGFFQTGVRRRKHKLGSTKQGPPTREICGTNLPPTFPIRPSNISCGETLLR
jgi:hypothetical protein